MNLRDEIIKKSQLPKPTKPAQFEKIKYPPKQTRRAPIKSKNTHLFDPERRQRATKSFNQLPDESTIRASILKLSGGDSCSNRAIEESWRQRVRQNELRDAEKIQKQSQNEELDERMAELSVLNKELSSNCDKENHSNTGFMGNGTIKPNTAKINKPMDNEPVLTALEEDPEIFCLRDTATNKPVTFNDFHFSHRGTKKKMTPRAYALYGIDDEDFVFKKQ